MPTISFDQDFFKNIIFNVFKFICSIYVWNITIYKNIESIFEKNQYQEPKELIWIDYLTLEYDDRLSFRNTDIYTFIHDFNEIELNRYYDYFHTLKTKSKYIVENLFIAKHTEGYFVKTSNNKDTDIEIKTITEKSSVRFIYVEYSHPDMNYVIELDLPDTMYFNKNEILSSSFVMRMLEKQTTQYIFDEKYKLTLLDNSMNSCVLNMHNYITLYSDRYTIEEHKNMDKIIDLIHTSEEHAIEKIYTEPYTVFLKDFSNLLFPPNYVCGVYHFDSSSDQSTEDETFQIVDAIKK
jgi:hypothetical protein